VRYFFPGVNPMAKSSLIVHRDPRYFSPDPLKFWPERWTEDGPEIAETQGKEFRLTQAAYIPFSFGMYLRRPSDCFHVLTNVVSRPRKLRRSVSGVARDADCACDHHPPLRYGVCTELHGPRLGRSVEGPVCVSARPVVGHPSPADTLNKQSIELPRRELAGEYFKFMHVL
jgi:hypothetical protein